GADGLANVRPLASRKWQNYPFPYDFFIFAANSRVFGGAWAVLSRLAWLSWSGTCQVVVR
ncbi:MAG: hypothetical protein WCO57_10680, partial [Verrucomicrobiota bacterium]